MSTRKSLLALGLGITAVTVLAGCVPQSTSTPTPTPSDSAAQPEPAPSLTPNPPEADSILWVRTIATAANGAELSLEAMVHRSVSYEYPGSQTINTNVIEDCGATLTNAIFAADKWSFTRLNVTAIPPVDATDVWPEDGRINFRPSADNVYMSARGMIQSDEATGDLACLQDKYFVGSGRGAFFVGIPGDTIDLDNFTNAWAAHTWGFTAPAGVTFSDCSFEITPLGNDYGADDAGWVEVSDASNCYIGPISEPSVF